VQIDSAAPAKTMQPETDSTARSQDVLEMIEEKKKEDAYS